MMENLIAMQRKKRALTQEEVSALSGLSVRTIQRAEAGKTVGLSTLRLLADAMGVPVASIVHVESPELTSGLPTESDTEFSATSTSDVSEYSSHHPNVRPEVYAYVHEQIRQFQKRRRWVIADIFLALLLAFSLLVFDLILFSDRYIFWVVMFLIPPVVILSAFFIRRRLINPFLDRMYPLASIEPNHPIMSWKQHPGS